MAANKKLWLGATDSLEVMKKDRSVGFTVDGSGLRLTAADAGVMRTHRVEYDFAVQGGAIGTISLGVALPAKAIILDGLVDVITQFTTAGADAGTIALGAESNVDLKAAIAVSDGTNPYDPGMKAIIPIGTAATAVKTTVARQLKLTIAGQAVTAGKLVLFVHYIVGG